MDRHAPPPSRSLPAWIPYLWSQVLFPGRSPTRLEPARLSSLLILLILPALLLYPCMAFRLLEPDEGRYAEIPREMSERGDWLVPCLQGQQYLDKPPLVYWLVMLSYRVFGEHDWSARLVPALAVHGCVLLTYWFGRRLMRERAAFWGALLLGLAPGFTSMGRLLLLDGVLALWATLALFSAFEALRGERLRWGWWLLSAAACGLGVLTKGPVALLLLALPLVLQRWLTGSRFPLRRRDVAAFGGGVLTVALPWYMALCVRIPGFARYFLWEHNIQRFLMPFAHEQGVWYYGPILLGGLLPGALLLVPFVRFLFSSSPAALRRRTPELGFLLLSGGWCVFFFSVSTCKLPTYILPAYPPLCLALGYFLTCGAWRLSRVPAAVAVTTFVLMLAAHSVVVPWYAAYRSPMYQAEAVTHYCADRSAPVVCYPRDCDSVSFYLRRDDLRNYRSKEIEELRTLVRKNPRTIVLCTHRHSLQGLKELLPPETCVLESVHLGLADMPGVPDRAMKQLAKYMGETALGLCDVAVIGPRAGGAEEAENQDAATLTETYSRMNHFDQGSRFAAKLDAIGFLRWLLDDTAGRYRFRRWLDARRLPFPGHPEGFCDTVAELDDRDEPSPPWAVPIEFQTEPDAEMFGRFLMYLGQLWLELRPDEERGSRYQVGGIVVNLTGRGYSSRDMKLGDTLLRTHLGILDCDMASKDAKNVLDGIAAGTVSHCLLPWIPLMHGGDEPGIIERWKELAGAIADERRRAEYAGLALVFAEAADRKPAWQEALKEWNVKVSQTVLEWQAEARRRGRAEGRVENQAEAILRLLRLHFPSDVPTDVTATVRAMRDLETLNRWFDAAASATSLEDFRRALRNGGT